MTALTRQPTTQNFLSPHGFQFNVLKAPAVNFFVQSVALPGLTLGEAKVSTPFSELKFPGVRIDFTDLNVTFKADEDLQGYFEIYNWMKSLGFPDKFDQYDVEEGIMSDISLIILSNQQQPIYTVTFKDAFPIMLGPLRFDTTQQSLDYLIVDTTFAYRSYDITAA